MLYEPDAPEGSFEVTPDCNQVQQREHERIVAPFADPSTWVLRELLHACWGRRAGQGA
jgi:hypothetical protein